MKRHKLMLLFEYAVVHNSSDNLNVAVALSLFSRVGSQLLLQKHQTNQLSKVVLVVN